jgi:hypothetical protein
MAEGTNSYHGLAVPLFGESEIKQQTVATDILTLTGGASQTGDFLVCQNSTGTENFVISASGAISAVVAPTFTVSSSGQAAGVIVSVTSTGAIAQGATLVNAVLVNASSKSVLNSIVGYDSTAGAEVATCEAFFAVHGSKAPSYLFSVGATAAGVAAAADNGFVEVATRFLAAPDTTRTYAAAKVLAGSKVYYIPMVPDTGMADT